MEHLFMISEGKDQMLTGVHCTVKDCRETSTSKLIQLADQILFPVFTGLQSPIPC